MDVISGRTVESLKMNVESFSVAPCVQREASSNAAIASCRLLHEAGVTVSLRGPVPDQLTVMRAGFPLKVRAARACWFWLGGAHVRDVNFISSSFPNNKRAVAQVVCWHCNNTGNVRTALGRAFVDTRPHRRSVGA